MLSKIGKAAALSLACLAASAPAAAQPAPAAPQPARWHLDGASSRCVLTRRLEGSPLPATFVLRTIPGSGRYDVILAAPDMPSSLRRGGRETRLSLAPGTQVFSGEPTAVDLPGGLGDGIMIGPLPGAFALDFGRASSIRLADNEGRELGGWTIPVAARAAEALAYCEAEKQVEWGADPAGFEPGATPARPIGDTFAWVTPRELAVGDAFSSVTFTAVFRLMLGPDGRATSCTLLESASNAELDGACRALVRRARYEPARAPNGDPVRSVAIHFVSLRMDMEIRIVPG